MGFSSPTPLVPPPPLLSLQVSRAAAGPAPLMPPPPLLSPQVYLAEAVLWEESSRVAGIFAQCECQRFPGNLCNIGGDSPDSGTSNRYKASPV